MDQVVKYSNIKTINDVTKTFATLPMDVLQNPETGQVKFTIANFIGFLNMLTYVTAEFNEDFIVTESNVAAYESDAASINKLIKFIKDGANDYVMQFAKELLGVTRGKNRYDGQVQICEKLLNKAYDNIHKKTVAFREEKKALEKIVDLTEEVKEAASPATITYVVTIPESDIKEFETYLKSKGYQARKEQ